MREADYKIKDAEWKLFDPSNPHFLPVGYKSHGLALKADYQIQPNESAEQYWDRVRTEILLTHNK